MRGSKWLLVLTVMIVAAGAGWSYAKQSRASGTLSPQDFLEIDQLVQGYARGIDIGPEDPSWVFTPDGVFSYPGRTISGEKQLKEFFATIRKNHLPTRRLLLSNLVVKASPEGATGSVYFSTIEGRNASKPIAIAFYGMYEDTFVKTAAGWRIKRRVDTHVE